MLLPDVNVLIYAHFEDIVAEQAEYARWLTRLATGSEPFALSVLVLSGFVRIATNPRIFDPPSPLETALRSSRPWSNGRRPGSSVPVPTTWKFSSGCAVKRGRRGSWSPTLNTLRSRWSTAAPWFPPTPTSTGSPRCGAPPATPRRHVGLTHKAGGRIDPETGGSVQDHQHRGRSPHRLAHPPARCAPDTKVPARLPSMRAHPRSHRSSPRQARHWDTASGP